ncbi:MAG: DNA polymerase III subunit beta [Planctomycetota bacterium]
MKFLVDKSRLESALQPILSAVPAKESPRPALRAVHLTASEDSLLLQGSNLELSVEVEVDSVKVDKQGSCLVPARPLGSLLHEISDPTIELSVHKGTLKIPTSSGTFELVTSDPEGFPELDFEMDGPSVDVPIDLLVRLYSTTEFACAREATKYAMNGVLMSIRDQQVDFVATDGRRLAVHSAPIEADAGLELQALLPHRSFGTALRALQGMTKELVGIRLGEGSVCLTTPDARMSIQKILGSFPDYQAVIPRDTDNAPPSSTARCSRPSLRRARRSSPMR